MIAAYTFFSNAHRTYTKNDYVEPNFNKLKKNQNHTAYVSDHNGTELEIRKITENSPNTWKLSKRFLSD